MTILRAVAVSGLALCASVAACSQSTPTTPTNHPVTTPTPALALSISGPTALRAGFTSQLTAVLSTGGSATGVTWTSDSPAVATVSSTGVLTGIAVGTATVTATAQGLMATASVNVQAAGMGTVMITGCGRITAPGHYVLASGLAGVSPCLQVASVADVQIDCASNPLPPITLDNVNTATVSNCVVSGNLKLTNTANVTVTNCTILNGILWAVTSTNVAFLSNTVTNHQNGLGAAISLGGGSGNRVEQNILSGGYDLSPSNVGTDDGILLENESGDTVQGNTINNFYDAGVEGVDAVTNTTIANNTMTNLGTSGVASYWCTDWNGNTIGGNSVSSTPFLAWIVYQTSAGLCGANPTPAVLSNNQFVGNTLRSPTLGTIGAVALDAGMFVNFDGDAGNNLLANNDFGADNGPELNPLSAFVDGGGNVCGVTAANTANFVCAAKSPSRQRIRQGVRH